MDTTWIVGGGLALAVGWFVMKSKLGKIAPGEARALVAAGGKLIDVRTPGEFAAGHIEGAENVPLADVARHVSRLSKSGNKLVVYCQSGMRSASATRAFRDAGIDAVDLGGMSRWE